MNVDLKKYCGLKICAAVSGGRDSMALLHYLHAHAAEYDITLTALNCDHKMRGEISARDSAFVADYCKKIGVPLSPYVADTPLASEGAARLWRLKCYLEEAKKCDCIATAHHLDDNAETVLFNLARGAALNGMEGITDSDLSALADKPFRLIRPLIACSRAEIDEYVAANSVPYVDDETNFKTDYTRNKIRHNVLPALEDAVPGAARAIYRFSRLAAEDEEYFERQAEPLLSRREPYGDYIAHCEEKVIFRRAALKIIAGRHRKKDYTGEQFERLYGLQFAENGKRFEFLGLTAFKEEGRIFIADSQEFKAAEDGVPFSEFKSFCRNTFGSEIAIVRSENVAADLTAQMQSATPGLKLKILRFDGGKIPQGAIVRFMRAGDRFTKFGGGTKNLGDWFTDKKIPLRLRKTIPLLCDGSDVLIVFGMEISDKLKTDGSTREVCCAIAADYSKL